MKLSCHRCGVSELGDVRFLEHGTDDMALCKRCFREVREDIAGEARPGTQLDERA